MTSGAPSRLPTASRPGLRAAVADLRTARRLAAGLLAAGALIAETAQAAPIALLHDRATGEQSLATLDLATGTFATVGTPVDDCCILVHGVSAYDATTQRAFAVAANADGTQSIVRFPGGAAPALPPGERILALAWDTPRARLVGLARNGDEVRFTAFDEAGAMVATAAPIPDCCIVRAGASALSADGNVFQFVGHSDGAWRLFRLGVSTGLVTSVPITAPLDVLVLRAHGVVGTFHDRATGAYRSVRVLDDGAFEPVGERAGCCAITNAAAVVEGGELVLLAGTQLVGFDLATGANRTLGTIATGTLVHALLDGTAPVIPPRPDPLFRDSFEAAPVVTPADDEDTPKRGTASGATSGADGLFAVGTSGSGRARTADPSTSQGAVAKGLAPVPVPAGTWLGWVALMLGMAWIMLRRSTRAG